jgi:predicted nucleic acid-binding protein
MTFMTDSVFLDTNVLVAAGVQVAPFHEKASAYLRQLHEHKRVAWISRQILREYVGTLTRPQPYSPAFPGAGVAEQVELLQKHYRVADEDARCSEHLLAFIRDGRASGKQVHDANIVATMQVYGIKQLVTLNVGHFRRFEGLIDVVSLVP